MRIGEKMVVHPAHLTEKEQRVGTVVYIHPQRRFYMVEYQGNGWSYRECFWTPRLGTRVGVPKFCGGYGEM